MLWESLFCCMIHKVTEQNSLDMRVVWLVSWTHLRLASFLWDIGMEWRYRPDAANRGVWLESPLCASRIFYQNLYKNVKIYSNNPFNWNELAHLIRDKSG